MTEREHPGVKTESHQYMKIGSPIKRENTRLIFYVLPIIFFWLGLVAYKNIIDSFFISDDFLYLHGVSNNGPFDPFFNQWTPFHNYRPLPFLSIFIDYKIGGLTPDIFHITNILIHSLNSFFVFVITYLMVGRRIKDSAYGWVVALISGIWYLFMSSHAEAVTWIACRPDLLATFFGLSSFIAYYFYSVRSDSKYLFVSLSCYCFALFSKESVVTLPIIMLCYEFFFGKSQGVRKRELRKIVFVFTAFASIFLFYLVARLMAMDVLIGGYGNDVHLNTDPLLLFHNIIAITIRIFFPPSPHIVIFFCIGVFAMTCSMVVFRLGRAGFPGILYFILCAYLISVLPVINLYLGFFNDTQGERFLYFPSVFLVTFWVIFMAHIFVDQKKYFILLFLVVIFLSGRQLFQVNNNWVTAGKMSENLIHPLYHCEDQDKTATAHLPDCFMRAYVSSDGIREAVDLFVPQK